MHLGKPSAIARACDVIGFQGLAECGERQHALDEREQSVEVGLAQVLAVGLPGAKEGVHARNALAPVREAGDPVVIGEYGGRDDLGAEECIDPGRRASQPHGHVLELGRRAENGTRTTGQRGQQDVGCARFLECGDDGGDVLLARRDGLFGHDGHTQVICGGLPTVETVLPVVVLLEHDSSFDC